MYATNHHISLGQISHQLQNHQNQITSSTSNNNNLLRLGSAPPKFEQNLISSPPLNHSSSFGHSIPSSSPFFNMSDISNQSFEEQQSQQGQFLNKQLHGLMHLPDLQGNTNTNNSNSSNLFNLMVHDQFNNMSSTQGTTLYINNNSSLSDHQVGFVNSMQHGQNMSSPHMSATALLQKASQIGSTNSTNNNKGSNNDHKSGDRDFVVSDHNNINATFGNRSSSIENDHDNNDLHGLINSIANGNTSSIFGNESNLNMRFGGSDKLTLDFLGVGGMVRNMSGGFSQSEQQRDMMNTSMVSLNHDLKSAHSSQHFGSSNILQ